MIYTPQKVNLKRADSENQYTLFEKKTQLCEDLKRADSENRYTMYHLQDKYIKLNRMRVEMQRKQS